MRCEFSLSIAIFAIKLILALGKKIAFYPINAKGCSDKKNYVRMYAMGSNVAGLIGTVSAAGIFPTRLG